MIRTTRIRVAATIATIAMVFTSVAPAFGYSAVSVKVSGSTTVFPLASKWASVYKSKFAGSSITVVGGGSSVGVSAAKGSATVIGMSSRMKAIDGSDGSVVFTPIARDALVIVVNTSFYKKYPKYIYRLSAMQIQNIFRGKITNWKQINSHLPSHSINLVGRTGSSGTYTYFKQAFLTSLTDKGQIPSVGGAPSGTSYKQSSRTKTYASNGIVRSTVAHDQYAIGYLSEAYVDSTVKPLNLQRQEYYYDSDYNMHATPAAYVHQWVVPSASNALKSPSSSGTYPYVRPLYFVTQNAVSASSQSIKDFIGWCLSKSSGAGQSYVTGQKFLKMD
jgi:phosphate transport system substrate-binding protein